MAMNYPVFPYREPREHVLFARLHAHVRFRQTSERRALWLAEDAAHEDAERTR